MKKLIVLLVFIVGLLPTITATEYFIVKIGKKLTIYSVTDYGESNYWGRNVVIDKSETIIPSDSYFEGLDIPKNEWDISFIEDDEKSGSEFKVPDFMAGVSTRVSFDHEKFTKLMEKATVEVVESKQKIQDELTRMKEIDRLRVLSDDELFDELLK